MVVTQPQPNLADDVLLHVTATNHVRHLLLVCRWISGSQSSEAFCHGDVRHLAASVLDMFLNAASHISMRARTRVRRRALDVMESLGESLTPACILAHVSTQEFDPSASIATPFFL